MSRADIIDLRVAMSLQLLETACDYYYRFMWHVDSFPWKLCWLVYSSIQEKCERRLEVSLTMLELLRNDTNRFSPANNTAFKLALLCGDLVHSVVPLEGKFPPTKLAERFYRMMREVALSLPDNTQLIEGENGTIKAIKNAAPHISWQLLSSRTVNNKMLTPGIHPGEHVSKHASRMTTTMQESVS